MTEQRGAPVSMLPSRQPGYAPKAMQIKLSTAVRMFGESRVWDQFLLWGVAAHGWKLTEEENMRIHLG